MNKSEKQRYKEVINDQSLPNEWHISPCESFEYYLTESHILVLTNEAKEYMVAKAEEVLKLKELVRNGSVTHKWEILCRGTTEERYLYSLPALGITVNKNTKNEAIESAVETLKHQYKFYTTLPCSQQDAEERALVLLAHSVYKSTPTVFYSLLGLTNEHTQGDVSGEGYLV